MYKKIDGEAIILYCLYVKNEKHSSISFRDLNNFRERLEEDGDYLIDITYDSLRQTILKFHDFLELSQESIKINWEEYNQEEHIQYKIESMINSYELPIKEKICTLFEEEQD